MSNLSDALHFVKNQDVWGQWVWKFGQHTFSHLSTFTFLFIAWVALNCIHPLWHWPDWVKTRKNVRTYILENIFQISCCCLRLITNKTATSHRHLLVGTSCLPNPLRKSSTWKLFHADNNSTNIKSQIWSKRLTSSIRAQRKLGRFQGLDEFLQFALSDVFSLSV